MRRLLAVVAAAALVLTGIATPGVARADPVPGAVVGWGNNGSGQLNVPAGLTGVTAIAAGYGHSLALKSDGTVIGWGGTYGQATPPVGLTGVTAIAAGTYHSLALKSDGSVVGWGLNTYGQAAPPVGLAGVLAIAGGAVHSLALKSDGSVVGWGWDRYGQVTAPAGLTGVVAVAAGDWYSLALKSDGSVVGWGQVTVPAGLTGVVAIAAGSEHCLALKGDGSVVGWGSNSDGQATPPAGLTQVTAIAAGTYHSLALESDGSVVGWGSNYSGQLNVPAGLTHVTAIAAGYRHSLAVQAPAGGAAFEVHRSEGAASIYVKHWPAANTLTVTIDDPGTLASPDYTTEVVAVETDEGYGGGFGLAYEIGPGDDVTVTDGTTTKSHLVIGIQVTSVDINADRVSGTATPNSAVKVYVAGANATREITAATDGNWVADFSASGGPDEPPFDIVAGASGGAEQFDADGDSTVYDWRVTTPRFSVSPIDPPDNMWGEEWAPDSDVTIEIDDPETAAAVDFSTTAGTDGNGHFELGLPFDIEAGHVVTVSEGATVKTHVVIDLRVTLMDPVADTVSGVGAPRAETVVTVWDEQLQVSQRTVTSGDAGAWTADFSPAFDILPGMWSTTTQADEDGDTTMIVGRPPAFLVFRDWNGLTGSGWPAEIDVHVTADDPETAATPDIELTLATNAEGFFEGAGVFPGLQPGWLVAVTDGHISMTHTVRAISITDADTATDVVRGTADPGTEVWVAVIGGKGVFATADASGEWVADFSGVYDITIGSEVGVQETDEDGSGTYFGFTVPFPPIPMPPLTSLTTESFDAQTSGTPTVNWKDPLTLSTTGRTGGTGTATLTMGDGYVQTITLVESSASSGTYTGTFAAPFGAEGDPHHHGPASISFSIDFPVGPDQLGSFTLYIDPSGVVHDTLGSPVVGATVTLYRSVHPGGTFVAVSDGSAIMGPGNRTNPDLTVSGGLFGWDVVAGYYRVRAQKAGCSAPDGRAYAETDALTIPPPITDLALVLDCAVNHAPSGANKTVSLTVNGTYPFSVADFGFSDPYDSPANTLLAVRIATLPSVGLLKLGGVAVSAGDSISAASIGTLTFTPAANASGSPYTTFTFQVQDNGGVANGGIDLDPTANTITLNVTGSGGTKLAFGVQPSSEQAGSAITPTITVRVLNASSALVSADNATVITLSIGADPGSGTLSGTVARTAVHGVATFPGLSINSAGNGYRLAASAPPLTGATSNAFNITPGPAVSLRVAGYPSQTNAFASHAFSVTALDAFGNTATGYTGTVHFTSNDGVAVLPATYHFSSFDNGVETFSATFRTVSPPTRSISATDVSRPRINGVQSGIVVNEPTIHHVVISPASSTITAGDSRSYTVKAFDSPSHAVGTVAAALSISPDGSCGGSSCTATTAGVHTVTATYAGKTATATLAVVAGSAADLVFVQQPTTTRRSHQITPAVTVRVVDAFSNLVTSGSYAVSIGIGSNPSRGSLSGSILRFTSGGVATFNNLSINRAGNGYRLVAGASFLGTVMSSSFNITP